MRIVQPISTYNGDVGFVVAMGTGVPLGLLCPARGDERGRTGASLRDLVGPHVLLMDLRVTVSEYRRLAQQMPAGVPDADC